MKKLLWTNWCSNNHRIFWWSKKREIKRICYKKFNIFVKL